MSGVLTGQALRFGCVGGVGFVVDAAVLYTLVSLGMDAVLARVFSFVVAVSVTWQLNRSWTFATARDAPGNGLRYVRYIAVQVTGVLCNYGCYVLAIGLTGADPIGALYALAIGSAVGLVVNFAGARLLVFNR